MRTFALTGRLLCVIPSAPLPAVPFRLPHVSLRLFIFVAALLALNVASATESSPAVKAARELVQRMMPLHADQIDIEQITAGPEGGDVFEVETSNHRLVLRGNSGVAIGAALNWYLQNIAHAQLSWDGDNPVPRGPLPPVPTRTRIASPYRYRAYLNYCTFNYTMAWWDRKRWEREIDWMALHGINLPLATTGQEAVWQATLRRFGMSDDEIRTFFVGPAFSGWQWLTNIEQWAGPLPQSWIDSHLELGKFILARECSLGMTPILQGFSGCVPIALIDKFPKAAIQRKQIWCAIPPGTAQLDPQDPLFRQFGRAFLEEQARLLGPGHLYAADPFHEGEPIKNTPEYLQEVGAEVFGVAHDFDPAATIVMQGWTIREHIVRGIPADRLLVLDLTGEKWKETDAFWGRPWVIGVLHNFGGRTVLGTNLPALAANAPTQLANPKAGHLVGVGAFPEAIEQNPVIYDLALDLAWRKSTPDLAEWLRRYVLARYGRECPPAQAAWAHLRDSVYRQHNPMPSMETPLLGRPALSLTSASPWGDFERDYEPAVLWTAWAELLDASRDLGAVDTYRYDLVDTARQSLADLSLCVYREMIAARHAGEAARFEARRQQFLALGKDLDTLLATRREFLLGAWLNAARQWGTTPAERDLYERNARLLLTVWGPPSDDAQLFEYAGRQWSGLIRGFYLARWEKFFAFLASQPVGYDDAPLHRSMGRPANDASAFYRAMADWEYRWCDGHETYPAEPTGDSVAIARRLYEKWHAAMREGYPLVGWKDAAP